MPTTNPPGPRSRSRWHWLLLFVPFAWCVAAVPWANTIRYAFGHVPFLLVWMIAGVLVGSAMIGIVYAIDRRRGDLDEV